MAELTIVLSNGEKTTREQIWDYLSLVFKAEHSGEPFPVDLDDVWLLAYSTKANAKRALIESDGLFEEGVDYTFITNDERKNQGEKGWIQLEKIYLSVSCFEFLIARKVRHIFELYRQCRRMVFARARQRRLPYHIRRYVDNYSQIPPGYFSILQQMTMQLIAPLEVQGYTLPDSMMPDISEGRLFCKWLREEKGLDPESFQSYEHKFEDGRVVPARLYPFNLLSDYLQHFQDEWLQKRAEGYFKKRDERVLPLLPKLLKPANAQNQPG
jgi:hypothetical protein